MIQAANEAVQEAIKGGPPGGVFLGESEAQQRAGYEATTARIAVLLSAHRAALEQAVRYAEIVGHLTPSEIVKAAEEFAAFLNQDPTK